MNLLVGYMMDRCMCFMGGYGRSWGLGGMMFIVKGAWGNRGFRVLNGGG